MRTVLFLWSFWELKITCWFFSLKNLLFYQTFIVNMEILHSSYMLLE